MKLFSRGNPTTTNAPAGPAAASAVAEAPTPEPAPVAPQPDVAAILESSVKDISEKVARLASNVESTADERTAMEAKLSQMEDRMRKLSSLTEMISAQYNPFVGDAPAQREPLPSPESGLAAPPLAAPAAAAQAYEMPPLDMPAAFAAPAAPSYDAANAPAMGSYDAGPAASMRVERFAEDFQSSLLLMKWADLMLHNAGSRAGVASLLEYYHNIGWLGDMARDQLLAYADGIASKERDEGAGDWRASTEFHEISLLYLERLRNLQRGAR